MPIAKLLITMSVPMMISMLIQALYNVVDSIFVAKISEDALTAVSLSFPLQNLLCAIAVGTGVGVNALVSRSLGEGNIRRAEKAANVQMFLDLVYTLATVVFGIFFARTYFSAQTDVTSIIDYGEQYVSIVCIWSLGLYFSQGFEKLLIATGHATLSTIAQAIGAVANIILDPIFIFGLGPIPAMGVPGAAIATVIGQFAATACALVFNLKYNKATHFDLRQLLPDRKILKFIYAVGLPSMLTIGLNAITSYCMNAIFLAFSTTAAAVYGVWTKLVSFAYMPVFGMNNGTIAIFSYNLGAKKIDRVFDSLRLSLILGLCITAGIALIFELFPGLLLNFFSASDFMMSIGRPALRLLAPSLIFGATSIIISSACQALGHARHSLLINLSRQFFFLLPIAFGLSLSRRLGIVWLAPLFAEALALAFVVIRIHRKMLRELRELQVQD